MLISRIIFGLLLLPCALNVNGSELTSTNDTSYKTDHSLAIRSMFYSTTVPFTLKQHDQLLIQTRKELPEQNALSIAQLLNGFLCQKLVPTPYGNRFLNLAPLQFAAIIAATTSDLNNEKLAKLFELPVPNSKTMSDKDIFSFDMRINGNNYLGFARIPTHEVFFDFEQEQCKDNQQVYLDLITKLINPPSTGIQLNSPTRFVNLEYYGRLFTTLPAKDQK